MITINILFILRFNACGRCCRGNPGSVCRAHGTGYEAASNELDSALQYGYVEVDISYSNLKTCPPQLSNLGFHVVILTDYTVSWLYYYQCCSCIGDS